MTKKVRVNEGHNHVRLPDGNTYDGPITVTLTDEQFGQIPLNAFFNEVLTDLTGHSAGVRPPSSGGDTGGEGRLRPSTTKIAIVQFDLGEGVTLPAGGTVFLDPTGASVSSGADWWGIPGITLPLDLTVGAVGPTINYPEVDRSYEVWWQINLTTVAANDGAMVGLFVEGNYVQERHWVPVSRLQGHSALFHGGFTDKVFISDTDANLGFGLYGEFLAANATVYAATVGLALI